MLAREYGLLSVMTFSGGEGPYESRTDSESGQGDIMLTASNTEQDGKASGKAATIEQAAAELADRLQDLADRLADRNDPTSVQYRRSPARFLKRVRYGRSPAGFLLDTGSTRLLLRDGRIWSYSPNDYGRFPAGRVYDVRADYTDYTGCRMFPGGREFVFIGVIIGKYTFGFIANDADGSTGQPSGLCAVYGGGSALECVTADEAFAAVGEELIGHQPGRHRRSNPK